MWSQNVVCSTGISMNIHLEELGNVVDSFSQHVILMSMFKETMQMIH